MSAVAAAIKGFLCDGIEEEQCLTVVGDEHMKNIFVCSKFRNPYKDLHAYIDVSCSIYSSYI